MRKRKKRWRINYVRMSLSFIIIIITLMLLIVCLRELNKNNFKETSLYEQMTKQLDNNEQPILPKSDEKNNEITDNEKTSKSNTIDNSNITKKDTTSSQINKEQPISKNNATNSSNLTKNKNSITANNSVTKNNDDTTTNKTAKDTTTNQTNNSNNVNKSYSYYIKVNYEQNVVTVYEKDSKGNFTIPVKAFICSTGTATPKSGIYSLSQKIEWHNLYGGVYGRYCSRIVGSILFHSVPYLKKYDKGSLEYWEYDKLGTAASAGCIRLTVEDAKWIFDNCVIGTKVEFYSDSSPGPLGKPIAQKISNEVDYRGWDPTDPSEENVWKKYKEKSDK